MKSSILTFLLLLFLLSSFAQNGQADKLIHNHIESKDNPLIDEAFLHGYVHNIVNKVVDGVNIPTLTIQCTDGNVHQIEGASSAGRTSYSIWTRDLYWGFLGWSQAGDDKVLSMMKSSLELLIKAKNMNQALGQNKLWPLNDKRFYIPQAYDQNLITSKDLFPWCSESQTDFILLASNYWKLSGDTAFIKSIWDEMVYVSKTLELMDTDGNSLPDALWGSYDYTYITLDTEEPLMCAKTSMAFSSVAELANILGNHSYADRLDNLAAKIKKTMNKSIEKGGLWKKEGNGGYYVMRRTTKKEAYMADFIRKELPAKLALFYSKEGTIMDDFIPYNNLVPMWCGMTSQEQNKAIFQKLDNNFDKIYNLKWGPMYCAPAGHSDQSVLDCATVTWLAFLDVYLRGINGHETNRDRIYNLLIRHARDAGGIVFSEGAGVYGSLTGGAGRSWDNGNFFHMLVCGIYGIEKSSAGIRISSPKPINGTPLTELLNISWRNAIYNFHWEGKGSRLAHVFVDGKEIKAGTDPIILTQETGNHDVKVILGK